ncbi:MAG: DUF3298 and DUF4163 domain-containing protein [Bacteroidales bacterium]|nr:DUF3298 and DUF4163 domain-containing protein [Bacteroidales bacterium]
MLGRILSFSLTVLVIISSQAQTAFYKHLEGKVGDNINIVLDIVAIGDNIGGYYYYYFDDTLGDDSWTHYGKSMPVNGKLNAMNVFEFSEFNPDVKGSSFKGEFKDGIITGTWTSSDGRKQLPFKATETYPLGTMAFKVNYLKDKALLTGKSNSPTADLHLSLLLPVDYPVASIADSVTAFIYEDFFEKAGPETDPSLLLGQARDLYFRNYKTSNQDIYQEGSASFNWEKIQETRILHNEHDVLSVENFTYGYTGGAHGLSVSKFRVIDLQDGHQVSLDEVFRDNYQNDLRDILNAAAREKYKLGRNQSLLEAGFFNESLDPGSNFYITKDGIGFYYNQYEVAPFALGPVEIFINYREIRRLLHPDSPAKRLFSGQ